jgi:transcriptional regulator with PAS, ATPase and Fis domain
VARARSAYDRGVPVLVVGETGTGKELVARALHYWGARSKGPFIAVNCASLPESLVEAELFGHVEGAFTGARRGGAQGRLELASGGTLFLDEIGDMPLPSQAKLLRVLQERCVVRLGDTHERPIDVALVCATHQDLPQLIAEKAFRQDLYYRINGLCVTLPPLRLRVNVLDLARHLLREQSACDLSKAAEQVLLSHPWPGNLRQLSHVIACATALVGDGRTIEPKHFPEDFLASATGAVHATPSRSSATSLVTLDQAEAELIERALRACQGNVSAAARALGVSRSTLYNKLKRS